MLTAGPGGGSFQYSQTILEAALALPRDQYRIVAAYLDPLWLAQLDRAGRDNRALNDSTWNRAASIERGTSRDYRCLHGDGLPRGSTQTWARFRAAECDLWVCPNHDRYAFRSGLPTLGTVHDLMHRYEPSFPEVSENGEFERREFHFRETCRWSKGVLVDSEVGKQQLIESYGDSAEQGVRAAVHCAGVYLRSVKGDDSSHRSRYKLPKKFFFYPAQFYRHKNHRALIEAIALMKDGHPDVRLVLVGARERNGFADVRAGRVTWSR